MKAEKKRRQREREMYNIDKNMKLYNVNCGKYNNPFSQFETYGNCVLSC